MKKILVVEDNLVNMKLFCDLLELQRYEISKASDGQEAYEKLKNGSFDMLILDIQLPKLDGFSLIEKLEKEKISRPKTLIVSAFAMDKDKQRAKELNIDDYMTKPIDVMNFINKVKNILEK